MLHLVLGALVVVLAVALGLMLRGAARLRAEAEATEARLVRLRARVEHASARLARSTLPLSDSPPDVGERRPRERRRTRRPPSPSVQP